METDKSSLPECESPNRTLNGIFYISLTRNQKCVIRVQMSVCIVSSSDYQQFSLLIHTLNSLLLFVNEHKSLTTLAISEQKDRWMVEGGGGEAHWQWYPGLAGLSPPSTLTCPPPGSTPDITTSGTHIDLTIDHFCNFTKTEETLSALIFNLPTILILSQSVTVLP